MLALPLCVVEDTASSRGVVVRPIGQGQRLFLEAPRSPKETPRIARCHGSLRVTGDGVFGTVLLDRRLQGTRTDLTTFRDVDDVRRSPALRVSGACRARLPEPIWLLNERRRGISRMRNRIRPSLNHAGPLLPVNPGKPTSILHCQQARGCECRRQEMNLATPQQPRAVVGPKLGLNSTSEGCSQHVATFARAHACEVHIIIYVHVSAGGTLKLTAEMSSFRSTRAHLEPPLVLMAVICRLRHAAALHRDQLGAAQSPRIACVFPCGPVFFWGGETHVG